MSRAVSKTLLGSKWRASLGLGVLLGFIFLIPQALSHPLIYGDNLTQNLPLRVLQANIELSHHLPFWNRYSWSGTPLLANFNAGTTQPLSWIFLLFSPAWAMSISLWLTFSIAAAGIVFLFSSQGLGVLSSAFGALLFTLSGAFLAQIVHIDMIQGIAFLIWALYFLVIISQADSYPKGILGALGLGFSYALVICAGAPEAMLDGGIVLIVFVVSYLLRAEHRNVMIASLAIAAVLALGLAAIQWMPGLEFTHISTRHKPSFAFASSGPFSPQFAPLALFPFGYGSYGSAPLPNYFASYNLAEISVYPLAATIAGSLLALFSKRLSTYSPTTQSTYKAVAVVSLLFALGAYTPLEHLAYHLPLYGSQRLPSRNLFGVDLALVALFVGVIDKRLRSGPMRISFPLKTVPILLVAACVTFPLFIAFSPDSLHSALNVIFPTSGTSAFEEILYVSLQGVLFITIVLSLMHWVTREVSWSGGVLLGLSIIDLIAYCGITLFSQVSSTGPFTNSPTQVSAVTDSLVEGGRLGLFDPNLASYGRTLSALMPDLNILNATPSIQGYASLKLYSYTNWSGTVSRNSFDPTALNGPLHKLYNLDELEANSGGFVTQVSPNPSELTYDPKMAVSNRPAKPSTRFTGVFFGSPIVLSSISITYPSDHSTNSCTPQAKLITPDGITPLSANSKPQRIAGGYGETYRIPATNETIGLFLGGCGVQQSESSAPVADVYLQSGTAAFVVDGELAAQATPALFSRVPIVDGNLSLFTSRFPSTSMIKTQRSATVSLVHIDSNGTLTAAVTTPNPAIATVSVAYAPGWNAVAIWRSGRSETVPLTQGNYGSQRLLLPKGDYELELFYRAPAFSEGSLITELALGAAITLALVAHLSNRRRKSPLHPKS